MIMIDTKSKIVLNILSREAKNGNYKIFDINDIIMEMPRHYRSNKETIKNILSHLERQDVISIKYDDEDTYCIAILPFGYELMETEKPKSFNMQKEKTSFAKYFLFLLSSFIGGILGGFLVVLISKMM